jgi:antitoxin component YwqK of YwqJK toxin-antitoxin module
MKNGGWISYYENGQLMYKGNYKNGKRDGAWISYNEDGTLDKEWTGTFKDGEKISD